MLDLGFQRDMLHDEPLEHFACRVRYDPGGNLPNWSVPDRYHRSHMNGVGSFVRLPDIKMKVIFVSRAWYRDRVVWNISIGRSYDSIVRVDDPFYTSC